MTSFFSKMRGVGQDDAKVFLGLWFYDLGLGHGREEAALAKPLRKQAFLEAKGSTHQCETCSAGTGSLHSTPHPPPPQGMGQTLAASFCWIKRKLGES